MRTLVLKNEERVEAVYFTRDSLVVDLMDGRTISVPLSWYPKLLKATLKQRSNWVICGGGYGIHWPDMDEDLSTEGMLRGASAPCVSKIKMTKKQFNPKLLL
ncbi:MAG: DUF2442 domain-containing protein [Chlamydiota bacterium]